MLGGSPLGAGPVAVPPLHGARHRPHRHAHRASRRRLEAKLAAFEARKGSQIAVLMVPTTRPETIEQYAIRVAEQWKLGRKGVDDGALLLVAKDDRALRIEVGYGLEGVLPDAVASASSARRSCRASSRAISTAGIDAGTRS